MLLIGWRPCACASTTRRQQQQRREHRRLCVAASGSPRFIPTTPLPSGRCRRDLHRRSDRAGWLPPPRSGPARSLELLLASMVLASRRTFRTESTLANSIRGQPWASVVPASIKKSRTWSTSFVGCSLWLLWALAVLASRRTSTLASSWGTVLGFGGSCFQKDILKLVYIHAHIAAVFGELFYIAFWGFGGSCFQKSILNLESIRAQIVENFSRVSVVPAARRTS